MKTFVAALAAFRILFGGVVAYCQTPLDAPGEKKVTVASEIERGRSEMADAAIKSHTLNLLAYEVEHDEVIERNKAKNTDSDGFLLGALLEQWIFVDQMYPTMASNGFTNKEGAKLVRESLVEHFRRFRDLQKKFALDDDALLDAAGIKKSEGRARESNESRNTKLKDSTQSSRRPRRVENGPTPQTPTISSSSVRASELGVVTLTQRVSINVPYGVIGLNAGIRLKLVSRAATTTRVQYEGADYDIPLSSTDLAK